MKSSNRPLWRKSMLQHLHYYEIIEMLEEISDNGDPYGYDRPDNWYPGEDGYYQEYKPQFDDLAGGAGLMLEALRDTDMGEHWDDMTVALLGYQQKVLGYDAIETDYYGMLAFEEDYAVEEAVKRIERLSKRDMLRAFRGVMVSLVLLFDIKAAHDCLVSIITELDERGAMLQSKNNEINRLYEDLTGKNADDFDRIIATIPQRMWVE